MKYSHMRMTLLSAAALLLAACQTLGGAVYLVHRTGSTVAQRADVIDACQVAALKDVPPAYEIRSTGMYGGMSPGFCTGFSCYGYGGYPYPAAVTSYDPNDALRARQFNRCLAKKGYEIISRPVCADERDALAYKKRSRQAPAAKINCVSGEPGIASRWLRTQ